MTLAAVLAMPNKTTPPESRTMIMDELTKTVNEIAKKLEDHDVLIEIRTKQDGMLGEIREFKGNFATRLEKQEVRLAALELRVYSALAVITAGSWALQMWMSMHK